MAPRNLLLLCGLIVSSTALADISYNFVEAGYGVISVDVPAPLDGDGDGPQIYGSHGLFGPFTVFAGATRTDFSNDNIKFDDYKAGLGWNHALGKDASVFFNLAYLRTDINVPGIPTYDQDGYGATLGYRAENQSPWEFVGTLDYVSVESGTDFGGGIALLYDVTRHFSVTGGVAVFDQSRSGFLGIRYSLD